MFPCVRSFQSAAATRTCFTRSSRTSSSTTGELSSCPELILSAPSPRFVVLLSLVVSSHRRFRRLVVSSSRCLVVSSSRRTVVSSSRRLVASLFRRFDCFVVSSSRRLVVSSFRRLVVTSPRRLVASSPRRLVVTSSSSPPSLVARHSCSCGGALLASPCSVVSSSQSRGHDDGLRRGASSSVHRVASTHTDAAIGTTKPSGRTSGSWTSRASSRRTSLARSSSSNCTRISTRRAKSGRLSIRPSSRRMT